MNELKLHHLREEIERVDRSILELLNQRAGLAIEIGSLKQAGRQPVCDPTRECQRLASVSRQARGPISAEAARHIFTEIISACRQLQGPTRVAFLGPEATFSHMAVLDRFGHSSEPRPCESIREVFREVECGRADFGVVPVENSTEGTVGATLDQFLTSRLKVCGETFLRVSHALLSKETEMGQVQRIMSHPQALGQCLDWLARNLPNGAMVATSSTAMAAIRASREPATAAIGNEMLSEKHGLNILARDIQDRSFNLTRFLIVGQAECPPTGRDKTSIWFVTAHRPGTLYKSLAHLADKGINLTKIESRPLELGPWEYAFFIDFEGHAQDLAVREALALLDSTVERLTVLGSYPLADSNGREALEVMPWNRGQ